MSTPTKTNTINADNAALNDASNLAQGINAGVENLEPISELAALNAEIAELQAKPNLTPEEKKRLKLAQAEKADLLNPAPEPAPSTQNVDSDPSDWEHAVDTLSGILAIELESIERGAARYVDFVVELIALHERDQRLVNVVMCKVQDMALVSGENGAMAWGRISDNLRRILKNRGYSFLSTRDSRINFRTDGKDRFVLETLGERKTRLAELGKEKEDQKLLAAKAAVTDAETAKLNADKEITESTIAARILEECARLGLDPLKIAALLTSHDA